jgi:methyltransferase-like protein
VEAKQLASQGDAYILGEFLERENAPCYFRDFAAKAEGYGLAYLCEAQVRDSIPEEINPEVGATIRVMSGNNLIPLEQYMDFFKGRTFRQTLLVKTAQATKIKRSLEPERAKRLHVFGRMICTDQGNGLWTFAVPGLGSIASGHDGVCQALQRISEVYPATRTVAQLAAEARGANVAGPILDAVYKAILLGLVDISTVPLQVAGVAGRRPRAWRLSRLDAEQGCTWTAGSSGTVLKLDPVCTALLPLLDGTHDLDALRERVLVAAREGRIRVQFKGSNEAPEVREPALQRAASEWVRDALQSLTDAAILE